MRKMTDKKYTLRQDLTPERMKELVRFFTFEEIANLYGATRQNVHRLYKLYELNKEIDVEVDRQLTPMTEIAFKEVQANDLTVRISIYEIDNTVNKALVGTEKDMKPKWLTIESNSVGQFISPSKRINNRVKKFRAYLKDFTILDAEKFNSLEKKYAISRIPMKIGDTMVISDNVIYESETSKVQLKTINKGEKFVVYVLTKTFAQTKFNTGYLAYEGDSLEDAVKEVEKHINKAVELPSAFHKYLKNV